MLYVKTPGTCQRYDNTKVASYVATNLHKWLLPILHQYQQRCFSAVPLDPYANKNR